MRADEAKRLAAKMNSEKIATQYAEILGHIHRRASDGHLQFIYGGYMYDQNKEALRLMGYTLANDKGTDSILVSWREAVLNDGEETPLILPS
jgi:hypothetical protein